MKFAEVKHLVFEVAWDEQYGAAEAARKHRNKWIHFTDIQKLGINPKASHRDTPGIYFYPTNWIANVEKHSGFQYGINMKYYYIADLNLKGSQGLDSLSTSLDELKAVAKRNGWLEYFEKALAEPDKYFKDYHLYRDNKRTFKRYPFATFWGTMDTLANEPTIFGVKMSWTKMLKGISWLRDKKGMIAKGEPYQMVALDPRIVKVVDHGTNKDKSGAIHRNIGQEIIKDMGGTSKIQHGKVIGELKYKGVPIKIEFDFENYRMTVYVFSHKTWIPHEVKISDAMFSDQASKHLKKSVAYNINKFLEELDTDEVEKGSEYPWTKAEMMSIYNAITLNRRAPSVYFEKGKIRLHSWKRQAGDVYNVVEMDSSKNGTLNVTFEISMKASDRNFTFKKRFGAKQKVQDVIDAYFTYVEEWKKKRDSLDPGAWQQHFDINLKDGKSQ